MEERLAKIRQLLQKRGLRGILLTQEATVAWLFGGRYHINVATETACACVLVTGDRVEALVNNIEAQRLQDEEGLAVDEVHVHPWFDDSMRQNQLQTWMSRANMATDTMLGSELLRLRMVLEPDRVVVARDLGRLVAQAMEDTCRGLRPGQSEQEIAAALSANCLRNGIEPVVNLVAGEERAPRYRHLLPTANPVSRYAILSVSGRRHGLVISASRMVHFGSVPDDLRSRYQSALQVETVLLTGSAPGRTLGEVLQLGMAQYRKEGHALEWQFHHQGGIAGYQPREVRAVRESSIMLVPNLLLAWNPTIQGVKVEDTAMITETGVDIITICSGFPTILVEYEGKTLHLPDILVL